MALSPLINGRDNVLKHFKATKHSIWKLYNANDTKSPMQTFISTKPTDALSALVEMLDVLNPAGSYILDTFLPLPGGDKNYVRADTSVPFTLAEVQQEKAMQGTGQQLNYTPAFGDHIKLIQDNARIAAELEYTKRLYSDSCQECARLENELKVANNLLDSYEAEDDEEEEQAMSGVPKNAEEAIAKLITENGGTIIEHFLGKDKEGLKDELKMPGNQQQPVNGIDKSKMPDLNVIIQILLQQDRDLHEHLYKLALIAQQKPKQFKYFLDQLDKF